MTVVAISDGMALLLIFVILPVVLALAVAALVQWRSTPVPAGRRTSDLLREGNPAQATLIDWRSPGQSFLDRRPMVTFRVEVRDERPFELEIIQSVPRPLLRRLAPGTLLDVRVSADRAAAAIVFDQDR